STGSSGCTNTSRNCSCTGSSSPSPPAGLQEPGDGRLSRRVLREAGGEIPPAYSTARGRQHHESAASKASPSGQSRSSEVRGRRPANGVHEVDGTTAAATGRCHVEAASTTEDRS